MQIQVNKKQTTTSLKSQKGFIKLPELISLKKRKKLVDNCEKDCPEILFNNNVGETSLVVWHRTHNQDFVGSNPCSPLYWKEYRQFYSQ